MTADPCRPRELLAAASREYPDAWRMADMLRNDHREEPDWPNWCFLPVAGWWAIARQIRGGVDQLTAADIYRLAALGAWRVTQGIYRFDPDVLRALTDSPITGIIPTDVLCRLPEWCVYIETPGAECNGGKLHGVFAHLEHDTHCQQTELHLLCDTDSGPHPLLLPIGPWSVEDSIRKAHADIMQRSPGTVDLATLLLTVDPIQSLLPLILYLCSDRPEIGDGSRLPTNPHPTRTKKGPRLFPPDRPTTWDVAMRIGAAIRTGREAEQRASNDGDGLHSVRPHIRRAHWHGFRSGPRKRPNGDDIPAHERRFDLRWLPPILVAADDPDVLPAVIHPVKA